jgi:hypothetical protein
MTTTTTTTNRYPTKALHSAFNESPSQGVNISPDVFVTLPWPTRLATMFDFGGAAICNALLNTLLVLHVYVKRRCHLFPLVLQQRPCLL